MPELCGARDGLPRADQGGGRRRECPPFTGVQEGERRGCSRGATTLFLAFIYKGMGLRTRRRRTGQEAHAGPQQQDGGEDQQHSDAGKLECKQKLSRHATLHSR